jgi:hypothetical protein
LHGCAPKLLTAPIKQESDDLRVQLMRTESEVYGDFHKLRTFHQDLFQSINRNDVSPYPSLAILFDTLFKEANATVGIRVNYDTTYRALQKHLTDKKKVALTSPFLPIYQSYKPMPALLPTQQKQHRETYFALRLAYQDSCLKYGIVRYGPQDYAEIINVKLIQWQDSLEEVGRMVARCKADLKTRFPQQKGKDFFAAYAPVSELEAEMKNFESILNQLQNALSRFEEGNQQDFIYFGPQIRQRLEVQANDDLIGQLALQMRDCRNSEKAYFSSVLPQ